MCLENPGIYPKLPSVSLVSWQSIASLFLNRAYGDVAMIESPKKKKKEKETS